MSADAGSGIKRHEAERLCFRRVDDLPHVDAAHSVAEHGEFVDEGDIDAAENILE